MAKRNQASVMEARTEKKTARSKQTPAKFEEEKEGVIIQMKRFIPTQSQKEAINVARENTLSIISGVPGSGKSTCILWDYCQEYLKDPSKQIVIIKTPVEAGMDKIGYLTGDRDEKLAAHFVANRKILEDFLTRGKVESDLNRRIHLLPPNYLLGMTFDNALVLVEEAQQMQPMILKLILERTGLNSRVCVVGDPLQLYTDTKEARLRNGLTDMIERFFDKDGNSKYEDVGYYEFGVEDVQRSDIVKTVIRAYYNV